MTKLVLVACASAGRAELPTRHSERGQEFLHADTLTARGVAENAFRNGVAVAGLPQPLPQ